MYQAFLIRAAIDEGGDLRSREYGVSEIGAFEAMEALRRFLDKEGTEHSKMEIEPSTPGKLASLNLSPGCIRLLN
jgi:hypothetical protein